MTRRQFLAACVILLAAWISGWGKISLRRLLESGLREDRAALILAQIEHQAQLTLAAMSRQLSWRLYGLESAVANA